MVQNRPPRAHVAQQLLNPKRELFEQDAAANPGTSAAGVQLPGGQGLYITSAQQVPASNQGSGPEEQSSPPCEAPLSSSTPFASSSSGGGHLTCTVCGDVATGRHYGSVACNGCKGFFRRTIRRNYRYTCRFNSNCQIDKHNRAVCRACRYSRCIQFGMKVDAVQSERDLIGKRARSFSSSAAQNAASPPGSAHLLGPTTEEDEQQQDGGQQQLQFESMTPSPSAGSSVPASAAAFAQPSASAAAAAQFSGESCDEPVPRKRSFSSGSKFDQGKRAFHLAKPAAAAVGQQFGAPSAEQAPPPPPPPQPMEDCNLLDAWGGRNGRALLRQLLCSEEKIKGMREAVIQQTRTMDFTTKGEQPHPIGGNGSRKASENDILQSLHSQLLLVIEWAKTLKPFAELPTEDQTALLKNFAAQHVVLCVAYRSTSDFLKLINDSCIPRIANGDDKDLFYRKDAERVMDLLVSPMRFLRVDDVEFVAMKACILFNPVARGLSAQSVMSVLQTRRQIFHALQQYVQAKMRPDEDRIGDLTFFILSPLQSLAKAVSEDVLVSKLSGVARLDQLMEELILEDSDPKGSEPPLTSSSGECSSGIGEAVGQQSQQQFLGAEQQNHAAAGGQVFLATSAWANNAAASAGQLQLSAVQQRSRHFSSSASSSSNSPPLTLLQPVVVQPPPPSQFPMQSGAPNSSSLSPINESDFSSSALSSYVLGASLQGNSLQQHHSQHHAALSAMNHAPYPNNAVGHRQRQQRDALLLHQQPSGSAANPALAPSASAAFPGGGRQQQQQFRPTRSIVQQQSSASQQPPQHEFWGQQQIGANMLFTPSTPGPPLYSGTSPSPPQHFGLAGGGANHNSLQQ